MTSPYVTAPIQPSPARPSAWPVFKVLLSVAAVLIGGIGAVVAAFFAVITWSGCFLACTGTNHPAGGALALLAIGLLAGGPLTVSALYRSRGWVWVAVVTATVGALLMARFLVSA